MVTLHYFVCTILVFAATFKSIHGLTCYSCNVSTSTLDEDACKGIGSLTTCASNSVCLSGTYKVIDYTVQTYTTVRTCFLKSNGQECDTFFRAQRGLRKGDIMLSAINCFICEKDDCNRFSNPIPDGIGKTMPSILLITLFSFLFMAF